MRVRTISFLVIVFLLLSSLTMPAISCPPPYCGSCCHWVSTGPGPSDGYCDLDTGADCGDCSGCTGECESCVSCSCEDDPSKCTGECHNGCSGGNCVDDESKCPGECDTCDDGNCTDHDYECNWRLCETCNDGECEDRCPALGKYCNYDTGMCEVCVIDSHCELCEECGVTHKCEHPCDDCYYPKYCGAACSCVECNYNYGQEDTTTCSTANNTTGCDCSDSIFSPCSSAEESVVYSGNFLKSCTGPNCGSANVLCYTTYNTCRTSGSIRPLQWCAGVDFYGNLVCDCILGVPGPGCYTCVNSFEAGVPTYESQGDCPIEDWP